MARGEEAQELRKGYVRTLLALCLREKRRSGGRERRQGPLDNAGRRLLLISNTLHAIICHNK